MEHFLIALFLFLLAGIQPAYALRPHLEKSGLEEALSGDELARRHKEVIQALQRWKEKVGGEISVRRVSGGSYPKGREKLIAGLAVPPPDPGEKAIALRVETMPRRPNQANIRFVVGPLSDEAYTALSWQEVVPQINKLMSGQDVQSLLSEWKERSKSVPFVPPHRQDFTDQGPLFAEDESSTGLEEGPRLTMWFDDKAILSMGPHEVLIDPRIDLPDRMRPDSRRLTLYLETLSRDVLILRKSYLDGKLKGIPQRRRKDFLRAILLTFRGAREKGSQWERWGRVPIYLTDAMEAPIEVFLIPEDRFSKLISVIAIDRTPPNIDAIRSRAVVLTIQNREWPEDGRAKLTFSITRGNAPSGLPADLKMNGQPIVDDTELPHGGIFSITLSAGLEEGFQKLLIATDDASKLKLLGVAAKRWRPSLDVVQASSLAEAIGAVESLETFRRNGGRYAIVTDLGLGDGTASELIQRVDPGEVPILLMSVRMPGKLPEELDQLREAGKLHFAQKPFSLPEFVRILTQFYRDTQRPTGPKEQEEKFIRYNFDVLDEEDPYGIDRKVLRHEARRVAFQAMDQLWKEAGLPEGPDELLQLKSPDSKVLDQMMSVYAQVFLLARRAFEEGYASALLEKHPSLTPEEAAEKAKELAGRVYISTVPRVDKELERFEKLVDGVKLTGLEEGGDLWREIEKLARRKQQLPVGETSQRTEAAIESAIRRVIQDEHVPADFQRDPWGQMRKLLEAYWHLFYSQGQLYKRSALPDTHLLTDAINRFDAASVLEAVQALQRWWSTAHWHLYDYDRYPYPLMRAIFDRIEVLARTTGLEEAYSPPYDVGTAKRLIEEVVTTPYPGLRLSWRQPIIYSVDSGTDVQAVVRAFDAPGVNDSIAISIGGLLDQEGAEYRWVYTIVVSDMRREFWEQGSSVRNETSDPDQVLSVLSQTLGAAREIFKGHAPDADVLNEEQLRMAEAVRLLQDAVHRWLGDFVVESWKIGGKGVILDAALAEGSQAVAAIAEALHQAWVPVVIFTEDPALREKMARLLDHRVPVVETLTQATDLMEELDVKDPIPFLSTAGLSALEIIRYFQMTAKFFPSEADPKALLVAGLEEARAQRHSISTSQ